MEVEGGSACSGSWPALVEDSSAERMSPRALLARGPVTRHVRARHAPRDADKPRRAKTRSASEAIVEPPASPSPAPRQLLYWRAGVIGVVAAVAASLLILANGAPPPAHEDEPLAAVGAASPETATVLQPKAEPAPVLEPERDALVEEVLYIEDDLDDEPVEPPPTDAVSAAKSASRARARDAARVLTSRARVQRAMGDTAGAERLLDDALGALPTYAPAAADLATLYIHRGDYRRALAYAKKAARSAPRKLSYMVLVGDAQHLLGNRAAATAQWRRAAHYGSASAEERLAKHGG